MYVVEIIFVLLGIALIATIIKYPKQVLIDLPAGILKIPVQRFLSLIQLITAPIWIPIYLIDLKFKWGIFEHKFFKTFYKYANDESDHHEELPDIEYESYQIKEIKLNDFKTYLISTIKDPGKFKQTIVNGINSLEGELNEIKIQQNKGYCLATLKCSDLYEFNYIIQWLDNELPQAKNYGFAKGSDFSFFGQQDTNTLNNVVGKTSDNELFAFNLTNGRFGHLTLSKDIVLKTRFTTNAFDKMTNY